MRITREAIVKKISNKNKVDPKLVVSFLNTLNEVVYDSLEKGKSLFLFDLGTFKKQKRRAKVVGYFGRGPMKIPARNIVKFTVSNKLRRHLNET
jgi:nucleoid DNA-binding protein